MHTMILLIACTQRGSNHVTETKDLTSYEDTVVDAETTIFPCNAWSGLALNNPTCIYRTRTDDPETTYTRSVTDRVGAWVEMTEVYELINAELDLNVTIVTPYTCDAEGVWSSGFVKTETKTKMEKQKRTCWKASGTSRQRYTLPPSA